MAGAIEPMGEADECGLALFVFMALWSGQEAR